MDNTDIKKIMNSLPSTEIKGNCSVCPQCGKKVSAEFGYCNFCGYCLADEYTALESENNDQAVDLDFEYAQYEKYNGDSDDIAYIHDTYNAFSDALHETTDKDVSDYEDELSETADYDIKTNESDDKYEESLSGNLFMCIFITLVVIPIIYAIINLILKKIGG
ncbi:MAG: hypothetical protein IJ062_05705 [Firmicutes bacterium]|nr:hypothetical protein [Bacillota bacterium]